MLEPVTFFRPWHWARSFLRGGGWGLHCKTGPLTLRVGIAEAPSSEPSGEACPFAHHLDGARGQRKLPSKPQRMWEAQLSTQVDLKGSGSHCGHWAVCGLGSCHCGSGGWRWRFLPRAAALLGAHKKDIVSLASR